MGKNFAPLKANQSKLNLKFRAKPCIVVRPVPLVKGHGGFGANLWHKHAPTPMRARFLGRPRHLVSSVPPHVHLRPPDERSSIRRRNRWASTSRCARTLAARQSAPRQRSILAPVAHRCHADAVPGLDGYLRAWHGGAQVHSAWGVWCHWQASCTHGHRQRTQPMMASQAAVRWFFRRW